MGLAAYKVDYSTTNFFKQSVDSVEGFEVPAAVELIGDRIWWPSTAARGGALREKSHAELEAEAPA